MKYEIGVKNTATGNIHYTGYSIEALDNNNAKRDYLKLSGDTCDFGLIYANGVN